MADETFRSRFSALHATHAVEQWKPDLVGISFSLTHHIEKANEYIEGLKRQNISRLF